MSEKKKATKKVVTLDAKTLAELTERLGPSRKVVKTSKAEGTENSVVLHLECGHKRVATKRATLRCRKCRKGARPTAAKKTEKKPVVAKKIEKKPVVAKKTEKASAPKREPVTETPKTVAEVVAEAMSHRRSYRK